MKNITNGMSKCTLHNHDKSSAAESINKGCLQRIIKGNVQFQMKGHLYFALPHENDLHVPEIQKA